MQKIDNDKVIIVGGGPIGLISGFWLAKQGISVSIYEKGIKIPKDLRASTWHPATLDMLDEHSISDIIISKGSITPSWQYRYQDTGEKAVFDLNVLEGETNHPYRVQCEQFHVVKYLSKEFQSLDNANLFLNCDVFDIHQDEEGVDVYILSDGEEIIDRGRYLIGCDGGHSLIRKKLGLGFQGKTYPVLTMVAITDFPFENFYDGLSGVNYIWTEKSNFSLLKVPDRWRSGITPIKGQSPEDALSDDSLESHFQKIYSRPGEKYNILARGMYQTHQRVTETFNIGRVLLAGDAAHLNSPNGGLGMNCGVHDAINLSEKLFKVWHGQDNSLFDLYTKQRKTIATEYVHSLSDANHKRMRQTDPKVRRKIMDDFLRITSSRKLMKSYLMNSSMIESVRYAESIE
ncbi:MAG: 6-hydroxy-3-succinoylpyridine 3-monooxygenase HspB [Alphaproteobacteria bacterium MarineAlpha2_Bin1]|nr:MAG: 6-hydroxy-3-succinoylpyridine 3-monooxygenase HspB [Alphaproteobacteria bacterium MarineAlpha2_Bin1]